MACKPGLLDQMCERICVKHYSIRTEKDYCEWVKQFIRNGFCYPTKRSDGRKMLRMVKPSAGMYRITADLNRAPAVGGFLPVCQTLGIDLYAQRRDGEGL